MSTSMVIAGWEMRGAARSRWVLGASALYATIAVAVALVNLKSMSVLGLRGVGAVLDGLIVVGVLIPPLFGILLGAGAISGSRESGMLALMAAQPLSRARIVWGTFVGLTVTVWTAVLVGLGVVAVILASVVTVGDLAPFAMVVGATLASAAVGVSLGLAISALAKGRGQATALATAVWFLAALGIDAILVVVAPVMLGPTALLAVVLLNPLSAIRMLGLALTAPETLGVFGVFLDDTLGRVGTLLLIGGAVVAWVLVPVFAASSALRRRDI